MERDLQKVNSAMLPKQFNQKGDAIKAILFCNLPYAFSILAPLQEELSKREIPYLWYVPESLRATFPYHDSAHTSDIKVLENFQSSMIFVPGNDVPWYLSGVKVQIFHGLAGEKKGHFRIRDYFDLYLTQGPYFTKRFNALAQKHQNFSVIETGWCKIDKLFSHTESTDTEKGRLLQEASAEKIILYAPTFSPSLTSAPLLLEEIVALSQKKNYLVIIKFHDKMDNAIAEQYEAKTSHKLIILQEKDITPALKIADIMISDTSSVVYEFLFLNKPVITLKSHSENILWEDLQTPSQLQEKVDNTLYKEDTYKTKRDDIIALYHPYHDGMSAQRMVKAVLDYITTHGISKKRALPLLRKIKMIKKYGLLRW